MIGADLQTIQHIVVSYGSTFLDLMILIVNIDLSENNDEYAVSLTIPETRR